MTSKEEIDRVAAHAYPAEHIGFLSEKHVQSLEEFKQYAQEKGYFTPAQGDSPPSHDDESLLRYLRARKYSVNEAFAQFKSTEDWRKDNHIEELYEKIDVQEYDDARKLYPQWTGRRDKRGIPLYVFEVAHLTSKAVAAYANSKSKPGEVQSNLPAKMLRLFALYEALINFALPLCSMIPDRPYPQTPVSQSSNIVDISNVSLKQFWNLKNHMQDASQLATAYYPETLDRIFILGAPAFFPTVWGWIKRWFDPITVSKIFILSKDNTLSTLKQFVDIENIPKKYGGTLDYTFGDSPILDEEIAANLKWINPTQEKGANTFPVGPIKWVPHNGTMAALAVGTHEGTQRRLEVASIVNLPPDVSILSGADAVTANRPRAPTDITKLPSGQDTHPPSPPLGEVDLSQPPSGTSTPASSVHGTPIKPTADLSRLAVGNGPLPDRSAPNQSSSNVSTSSRSQAPEVAAASAAAANPEPSKQPPTTTTVRDGTTSTRFEQQSNTHGDGQLAHTTPEVREGVAGDKHGVMEPGTVSQAKKEHPVPAHEEPQPGYVEQAKGAAGAVLGKVAGVVGLGGGAAAAAASTTDEGHTEGEAKAVGDGKQDDAIDAVPDTQVEEFLRDKNKSGDAKKDEGNP